MLCIAVGPVLDNGVQNSSRSVSSSFMLYYTILCYTIDIAMRVTPAHHHTSPCLIHHTSSCLIHHTSSCLIHHTSSCLIHLVSSIIHPHVSSIIPPHVSSIVPPNILSYPSYLLMSLKVLSRRGSGHRRHHWWERYYHHHHLHHHHHHYHRCCCYPLHHVGGYNFQSAWTTGFIAGSSCANSLVAG